MENWLTRCIENQHKRIVISIVIKTLSERARRICKPSELEKELKHLERVFGWNGYSRQGHR